MTASTTIDTDRPAPASLAAGLAPALVEALHGKLEDIRWFRADWQRGGAATARAVLQRDEEPVQVVIKIPVSATELAWSRHLQSQSPRPGDSPQEADDSPPVVPRLYASGDELGGYDFAWLVMEHLPHGPLGARWTPNAVPRIAHAAARFYAAAERASVDRCPMREDWESLLRQARDSVKTNKIPARQRWKSALKAIQSHLDTLVETWRARDTAGWIHGDLHPANALCREAGEEAPVTLIDLGEIRPGHWIEDAVYLERLLWTHPERLAGHKPVRELARARKALGLRVDEDYQKLAAIRRILLAATAPRFMRTEGAPAHLDACLERVEAAPAVFKQFGL